MKSNNSHNTPGDLCGSNLYETLKQEKEILVNMFLYNASHNELTEQIKRIDALCIKIDGQQQPDKPDVF